MNTERTLIKDGFVVDGSGEAGVNADLVIEGSSIVAVEPGGVEMENFDVVVDASDRVVAPGFIDIHSHSDLSLLEDGRGLSKIHQGVTTEVVGNCSLSPAPVTEETKQEVRDTFSYLAADVEWTWNSYEEYLERFETADFAPNVCPLVGYGAIRAAVKGFERGALEPGEMGRAQKLLDEVLEAGARGLSTGLVYIPCCWADVRELTAMARVVKEHDGLYSTHMRNESYKVREAVEETLRIVRASGVRTEISHLKSSGEANWGLVRGAAKTIYEARDEGWEIGFDVYPYLVGCTYLSALLPRWAREKGREGLAEVLADEATRDRLKKAIEEGDDDWPGHPGPGALTPEGIRITSVASERNRDLVGKSVAEVAEARGEAPWDCFFDLLLEENGEIIGLFEYMDEADVEYLYSTPAAVVGSDGLAIPPEGDWLNSKPHPRYYGTFPRFLSRYVREKMILTLEEGVRRITSLPAERLGLTDRGRLEQGKRADVVVFDPDELTDRATYEEPHRLSEGIEYLFVNGQPVIYNGSYNNEMPGELLRKK